MPSMPRGSHELSPFRFLGNDRCLDFLNTVIADQGRLIDLIQEFGDLTHWLAAAGVMDAAVARQAAREWQGTREGDATLAEARALREHLRAMVDGLMVGALPPPRTIDAINAILRQRIGFGRVETVEGRWRLRQEYACDAPQHLLAPLAVAAADLLIHRDARRLKTCENPACVLYFYDTARNGSRRWCDTSVCGNRIRVATHYQRYHAHPSAS